MNREHVGIPCRPRACFQFFILFLFFGTQVREGDCIGVSELRVLGCNCYEWASSELALPAGDCLFLAPLPVDLVSTGGTFPFLFGLAVENLEGRYSLLQLILATALTWELDFQPPVPGRGGGGASFPYTCLLIYSATLKEFAQQVENEIPKLGPSLCCVTRITLLLGVGGDGALGLLLS